MNEQNNNQLNNMMGTNPNNNEQPMNNDPMMNQGMMNQPMMNEQPMMDNPQPVSPENLNPQMVNPNVQNSQMVNNQPMNNNMMNQPMNNGPMMNQGMQNPQMMNNQSVMSGQPVQSGNKNNKKILIIIGGVVLAIVAVVVLILALTGGSKTLTCTMSETSFGVTMEMEATVKFKGNEAKSAVALITMDLGSMADYKDTYLESLEDSYSGYEEEEGVDVEITSDDSKIYVKISGENTNSGFVGSTGESYEEVKSDLEEEGFTCK